MYCRSTRSMKNPHAVVTRWRYAVYRSNELCSSLGVVANRFTELRSSAAIELNKFTELCSSVAIVPNKLTELCSAASIGQNNFKVKSKRGLPYGGKSVD